MKRRDFFEKCGQGTLGFMLAYFGLKAPLEAGGEKKTSQKEVIKKLLMQSGKTEKEADAIIADMEKKLPKVQQKCICRKCPTYVSDDRMIGYCHPLVSKSANIKEEKGCICGTCPVYKQMEMTKGYYCTRKSEMEQKMGGK